MKHRPNVIIMFVDDMGYGDLSCFNEASKIATPNIDALCDTGVRFTDCHSTSALCTPSRYGLLTGRYNWRSRLKSSVLPGGADPLIEKGRMTMADLFKQNGYYTAAVGKWHLGMQWQRREYDGSEYGIAEEVAEKKKHPGAEHFLLDGMNIDFSKPTAYGPNDYGFDYFFGTAASLDQPPYVYIENHQATGIPSEITGVFPLDRNTGSQQQLWQRGPAVKGFDFEKVVPDMHEKVLSILDEHASEPFFLYYPIHAVHGPVLPPEEFQGKSGLNPYGDMVLYLDHLVGTMTEKLKEKGIWEDTIFVFASDNGCSGVADYPLLLSKGHNPSYVFRGMKADIYEGGHHVPAILSWPDKYREGKTCGQMTCLSDLFATFAQMLDTQLPENAAEDSFNLWPAMDADEAVRSSVIHSSGAGCFSIRTQDWKLELCRNAGAGMHASEDQEGTSDEIPYQLYHICGDIGEKCNVAPQQIPLCLEMTEELMRLIENGRSNDGASQENAGMDNWAQLEDVKKMMEKMQAMC